MRGNLFSVSVKTDEARPFRRNGFDYVALQSGDEYAVKLHNDHNTRCDIELYIDGSRVGGFVARAYETITVERPEGVKRKFTFFNEDSSVARSVGASSGSDKNGLISAIFKPEKHVVYTPVVSRQNLETRSVASSAPRSAARMSKQAPEGRSFDAGVTVLGNKSQQTFTEVRKLQDSEIDWPLSTEISLRLVVDNEYKYVPLSHSYPPRLDRDW